MNFALSQELERGYIESILAPHRQKDFVNRMVSPKDTPAIDMGSGNWGTHKISYRTGDGGEAYVYPQMVREHKGAPLKELNQDEAWEHAKKAGEFFTLPDADAAEWFGKNYKKLLGLLTKGG